jgi:alpha-tubulin suppressor-like RCC1 family protein
VIVGKAENTPLIKLFFKDTGQLFTWGSGHHGQLGHKNPERANHIP